jgi:hypothetical protein
MLYPAELRARETIILSYSSLPEMPRTPFVWDAQVRRDVLEEELARLRELPYSMWRDVVGRQVCKSALGRDNRPYRIRVSPLWAEPGSEDIRVSVSLETTALHRRLMRQSFVITPDNRLRE